MQSLYWDVDLVNQGSYVLVSMSGSRGNCDQYTEV